MASGFLKAIGSRFFAAGGNIAEPFSRQVLYAANEAMPNLIPSIDQFIALRENNLLPESAFSRGIKAHGAIATGSIANCREYGTIAGKLSIGANQPLDGKRVFDRLLSLSEFVPPLDFLLPMLLRGYISEEALSFWFDRLGIRSGHVRAVVRDMAQYIPPVQDIIRFQIREVFNVPLRKELELDAEIADSPDYLRWAAAQGLGPVRMVDDQGVEHTRNFAEDYWAAHWQYPSPTQAYTMLQRLRPGRVHRFADEIGEVKPFLIGDLEKLLRVVDYAPFWRKRLAAISYRNPTRIDIRRMYISGTIDKQELIELNRDLGYNKNTAEQLAEFTDRQYKHNPSVANALKWFNAGLIDQDKLRDFLGKKYVRPEDEEILRESSKHVPSVATLGRWLRKKIISEQEFRHYAERRGIQAELIGNYLRDARARPSSAAAQMTRAKIVQAYGVGYMTKEQARDGLVALKLEPFEVESALTAVDIEIATAFMQQSIRGIRSLYLSGQITEEVARFRLLDIGVVKARVESHIAAWKLALRTRRRQLSAQQAIDAFKRGLIGENELRMRLTNLGYPGNDIDIFRLMAGQDIQLAVARAAARAARTAQEQQRAAEMAIKEQDRIRRQSMADLARHGSPSQLKSWIARGLINRNQMLARLRALGWPDADAMRLIAEGEQIGIERTSGEPFGEKAETPQTEEAESGAS